MLEPVGQLIGSLATQGCPPGNIAAKRLDCRPRHLYGKVAREPGERAGEYNHSGHALTYLVIQMLFDLVFAPGSRQTGSRWNGPFLNLASVCVSISVGGLVYGVPRDCVTKAQSAMQGLERRIRRRDDMLERL